MNTMVTNDTAPLHRFLNYLAGAAAAIALTVALAAPAFAERNGRDVAKVLAAIAAIAIIANQIDKSNDKDDDQPQPVRHPRVPAACAIIVDVNGGQGRYFSEHCMRREGIRARLPKDCARRSEVYGRVDRLYPERCLREAGFRTRGQ